MYNYILCPVIVYLRCCHVFAVVTTSGFNKVSDYRPAHLSEEGSTRSRLQCSQFCAKDSNCAGFSFTWMRGICISYVMDTDNNTVRFSPEVGIECYVKDNIWRSVFQVTRGSGVSAYSLWSNPGPLNEEACTNCGGNYKSGLVDIWKGVREVKMEMFTSESSVAFATFNATESDKMAWMSGDRIMTSSWNDVAEYMAIKPVTISVAGGDLGGGAVRFVMNLELRDVFTTGPGWMHVLDLPGVGCNMPLAGTTGPLFRYSARPNISMLFTSGRGLHGNFGTDDTHCNTLRDDYPGICSQVYGSRTATFADLQKAFDSGHECCMCGFTDTTVDFFLQGTPGYCNNAIRGWHSCPECSTKSSVFCVHDTANIGNADLMVISYR